MSHRFTANDSASGSMVHRLLATAPDDVLTTVLLELTAVLVIVSGIVHLHLWDIAYRDVATLGPLFLVQAIAGLILGVALALWRRAVLALAALGLMAGTIVGFILVVTVGLFGFKLHDITGWAVLALVVEGLAVVLSATAVWRMSFAVGHQAGGPAGP